MTPLQRWERLNSWLGLLTDIKVLLKLTLAAVLLMLAVNWFAEALSPAVVVVGKGLIIDAVHVVLSVFDQGQS